jgi:hypothetical protein
MLLSEVQRVEPSCVINCQLTKNDGVSTGARHPSRDESQSGLQSLNWR